MSKPPKAVFFQFFKNRCYPNFLFNAFIALIISCLKCPLVHCNILISRTPSFFCWIFTPQYWVPHNINLQILQLCDKILLKLRSNFLSQSKLKPLCISPTWIHQVNFALFHCYLFHGSKILKLCWIWYAMVYNFHLYSTIMCPLLIIYAVHYVYCYFYSHIRKIHC